VSAELKGLVHWYDRGTVWLSADMRSFEEVLETSAHEHCHAAGCADEDVPTLIGKMAVKHRTEGTVFIHRGDLVYSWMPPSETALRENVFALEIMGTDDATAYVNRGTSTAPMWRKLNLGW
jgi:hypothetical protein